MYDFESELSPDQLNQAREVFEMTGLVGKCTLNKFLNDIAEWFLKHDMGGEPNEGERRPA